MEKVFFQSPNFAVFSPWIKQTNLMKEWLRKNCNGSKSSVFLPCHFRIDNKKLIPTHRVHRVATAAFWRTFHHEGKISPGWWGWGVHAHPLSLHLLSPVKLQCTLQLSGQIHEPCFISTKICTYSVFLPLPVPRTKRLNKTCVDTSQSWMLIVWPAAAWRLHTHSRPPR